jgi:hypothetical protein
MTFPDPEHVQALGALLAGLGEVEILDITPHAPPNPPPAPTEGRPVRQQLDLPIDPAEPEPA